MVEDPAVRGVNVGRRHLSDWSRPRLGRRHRVFPIVNLLKSSQFLLLKILLEDLLRHRNRVHLFNRHLWHGRSLKHLLLLLQWNRLDRLNRRRWRRSSAFRTLVATIRALRNSVAGIVHRNTFPRVTRELVVATLGRRGRSGRAAGRSSLLPQLDAERWDQSSRRLVTVTSGRCLGTLQVDQLELVLGKFGNNDRSRRWWLGMCRRQRVDLGHQRLDGWWWGLLFHLGHGRRKLKYGARVVRVVRKFAVKVGGRAAVE